jgi:hypothetical protein
MGCIFCRLGNWGWLGRVVKWVGFCFDESAGNHREDAKAQSTAEYSISELSRTQGRGKPNH